LCRLSLALLVCVLGTSLAAAASSSFTINPNPAPKGQAITVTAVIDTGVTVSNAKLTLWLYNASNNAYMGSVSATGLSYVAGTALRTAITLPSNLNSGDYYFNPTVYNSGGTTVWGLTHAATFTVLASGQSAGVKWHPGHYASSNQLVHGYGDKWSYRQQEMHLALSQPNVMGYLEVHTWAGMETSEGVYDFSDIDNTRKYIADNYPGKRYGIMIWSEGFGAAPNTSGNGIVPTYVLNNPGVYGRGPDGKGGWWPMNYGATAAWWRPAVAARVAALFDALAKHASPYGSGYTYDTDPYVELVTYDETALNLVSGHDYNTSAGATQWAAIDAAIVASWPHTTVVDQNNYFGVGGSVVFTGQQSVTAANQGLALGGPDVYDVNHLTWGQQAYIGAPAANTTPMFGTAPYVSFVQSPDYPRYSLAAITDAATNTLKSPEIWWTIVSNWSGDPNNPGDFQTKLLPLINATPIPDANKVCPSNYAPRGGCNTR